jgi:hypothetical protein
MSNDDEILKKIIQRGTSDDEEAKKSWNKPRPSTIKPDVKPVPTRVSASKKTEGK